jgi:hypothetical protein
MPFHINTFLKSHTSLLKKMPTANARKIIPQQMDQRVDSTYKQSLSKKNMAMTNKTAARNSLIFKPLLKHITT